MTTMKNNQSFSLRGRSKSVKYALDGVLTFFKEEHNARIHLVATIIVVFLAIGLSVSTGEAIALTLSVGFVWVAEIFNTAIERMMDFISTENDARIKVIKDLAAAAVLVSAFIAIVTGCFVFIPKL